MQLLKINPAWLIKIYLFLNLFKPLIGIVLGREIITALSILISLYLFFLFITVDVMRAKMKKHKVFTFLLLFVFFIHLVISVVLLRTADVYPSLVSFFQIITPMLLLFVLESLNKEMVKQVTRFLVLCLLPFILFGFLEFILPLSIRMSIYTTFSLITTGEGSIDVAYYLGDTSYGGLRLGSLFFEPLTFAFVSTFFTIYLFSKKQKFRFPALAANILSLGKLPIATTFISLGSFFFRKLFHLYYAFVFVLICGVLVYFVKNAEEIALNTPSLGNHMLGLAYGLVNSREAPLLGHGFGTAGYVSYSYYLKKNETGPFIEVGGLMNGNESAIGSIAYQLGYLLLILFLLFFIRYFLRLVRARQMMMASGVIGYSLSLFLSESVLSITVVSVLLIFSNSLIVESENKFSTDY